MYTNGLPQEKAVSMISKEKFGKEGFLVIRGFYTPEETKELNVQIDQYVIDQLPQLPIDAAFYEVKGKPETIMRLGRMGDYDRYFWGLLASNRFSRLAGHLLNGEAVPNNIQWFNKPARTGKMTPPHQDGFYFMLEPNEALTMWLALDTADEENGCMRFIPRSHRQSMRPHQQSNVLGFSQGISNFGGADFNLEVPIRVMPGDLVIHHCLTIHRADANSSERSRRALGLIYYAKNSRVDTKGAAEYQKILMEKWKKEGKL